MYDNNAKQPIINGTDVHYCKIWEYVVQKYEQRLKRMLDNNEPPVFITEWYHMNYDTEAFWKIEKENLKYKLVIITYNKELKTNNKNILVIYDERGLGGPNPLFVPSKFAEKHYSQIMAFINN